MGKAQYAYIYKDTLKYIRESRNVTAEYLAALTKHTPEEILELENDANAVYPTITIAKELSKALGVPFAALYMQKSNIISHVFPVIRKRIVFASSIQDDSALMLAAHKLADIREVVIQTKEEIDEQVVDFSLSIDGNISSEVFANALRSILGLDMNMQKKLSERQSFNLVRRLIENQNVLVLEFDKVDVELARGMALFFDKLPIIGFNADDSWRAKSFSMIHELVHIIKKDSNFCDQSEGTYATDREECFCNMVAGAFWIPKTELVQECQKMDLRNNFDGSLNGLVRIFSVSKLVVIRRMLICGIISEPLYKQKVTQYEQEFKRIKEKQKESPSKFGKNVAREKLDQYGTYVSSTLLRGYCADKISAIDVCNYLNFKTQHIAKFFKEVVANA